MKSFIVEKSTRRHDDKQFQQLKDDCLLKRLCSQLFEGKQTKCHQVDHDYEEIHQHVPCYINYILPCYSIFQQSWTTLSLNEKSSSSNKIL